MTRNVGAVAADWVSVEARVRSIVEGSERFTAEAVAHIEDFLNYLRERTAAPTVKRDYYPNSLAIWWGYDAATEPSATVEFVVHPRMIEVYSFCGKKLTGIKEIRHTAGEPFPQELEADLPPISSA